MVAPEMTPFAKVGGLADVVGSLPKALAKMGHDVRIVLPYYGSIAFGENWKPLDGPLVVHLNYGHNQFCKVWEIPYGNAQHSFTVYLLEHHDYFGRPEVYAGPWGDHIDNGGRFTFLSRAALDLCYRLNWMPDVIHAHDWTTGFIPLYLNSVELHRPLGQAACVFTIHNLQHQGIFERSLLDFAGIPQEFFRSDCVESMGFVNMMKGAIYTATKVTTVSPNYASEIQTPEYGCGLQHVLKFKAADVIGVLNGIDNELWDPQTDTHIPKQFSIKDLSGKIACKEALQKRLNLEVAAEKPIFAVISRFVDQKGLDLLLNISHWLMESMCIQIAVLGTGEFALESGFSQLTAQYPRQIGSYIGYSNELAHLINAGSDFLLMPSRFEPCGLTQLYAMRYGTLPIARSTGGLVDTIEQYIEGRGMGTGFLFDEISSNALYYTIGWACSTFYDRKKEFRQLQVNAMSKDFSWDQSAHKYEQVYTWAIQSRRGKP